MIPVNIERQPAPNQERQEAIIRVQRNAIAADLRQIQADLRLDLLQARREGGEQLDAKTVLILEWHQRFSRLLVDCEHPQAVFDAFKALLQQILVDSIFHSALDANCLLGNDGGTYTEMGLQLYRSLAPAQFQNRSPLHPEDERPLETGPHVCARYMVAWLARHNVVHRNPQNDVIEAAHQQLNQEARRLPPPAMNQDEMMRQIMANQAQRNQQRAQERDARIQARHIQLEEQRRAELLPAVQRGFAPVAQRVDEVADRQLNQARDLNQDINREINVLQPAIDQLEREILELDQRVRANEEQNNHIQMGVGVLRNTHQQLAAETAQLEKQIKESEKAGLKMLGKALLIIGACYLGTLAVKFLMEAMAAGASAGAAGGTTVVFQPLPSGGSVNFGFKF